MFLPSSDLIVATRLRWRSINSLTLERQAEIYSKNKKFQSLYYTEISVERAHFQRETQPLPASLFLTT